MSETEVKKF